MEDTRAVAARAKPDYNAMSVQQLEQQRELELARQDQALDEIHRGVKGLKTHAVAINEEVESQISTLDGISETVDHTQSDLERGEKQAREVNAKKATVWKLYGFIAVLIVSEVVMSAAGVRFV